MEGRHADCGLEGRRSACARKRKVKRASTEAAIAWKSCLPSVQLLDCLINYCRPSADLFSNLSLLAILTLFLPHHAALQRLDLLDCRPVTTFNALFNPPSTLVPCTHTIPSYHLKTLLRTTCVLKSNNWPNRTPYAIVAHPSGRGSNLMALWLPASHHAERTEAFWQIHEEERR